MTPTTGIMPCPISESNISFTAGSLSSDTGVMLPLDFIIRNHLLDPVQALPFHDERVSFKEHNSNTALVTQILFRTIAGYHHQSDQSVLREDPVFQTYFPSVASQSSISRLFRRVRMDTCQSMANILTKQACTFVHTHLKEIVLDIDSTKTDSYGTQELSAYIPHYGQEGYHPLLINEYNTGLILYSQLRPGNTYSSLGAEVAVREVLEQISDSTPEGKLHSFWLRGDAAFYSNLFIETLEKRENPVHYVIRAKGSSKLRQLCINKFESLMKNQDWFQSGTESPYTASHPWYGEINYTMSNSHQERRVCFKIYHARMLTGKGKERKEELVPIVFAVITNITESLPSEVIEFYCLRGDSENFTKELKDDFGAKTLSHSDFWENAFEFLLKSFSYNLFKIFRYLVLEGKDCRMRARTWRNLYQKVASKLVRHAGSVHLRITISFRYKHKFKKYLHKSRTETI